MTPIQRTLLAIGTFVAIALGLFIWFIANWDKTKTQPIGGLPQLQTQTASLFSVSKNPGGRHWTAIGSRPSGDGSAPVQHRPQAGQML